MAANTHDFATDLMRLLIQAHARLDAQERARYYEKVADHETRVCAEAGR